MVAKKKIINWIKFQIKEARAKGVVLGLSGGVDSAAACALAVKAIGKNKVLPLILPIHSQDRDVDDALLVAKQLKLKAEKIDLSKVYDRLISILPKGGRLIQANLKPRLRMLVLYYFANKLNYLVCGTGNKSELLAGYFTKHGDGACDILPLGSLLKRDVRLLARELDIPEHIINKPPSAGLWRGQTDEGEMGMAYALLDEILSRLENNKKQSASKERVDKVKKMIRRSEHKRQGPIICPVKR